jgi:hypothetical protein
MLKNEGVGYSGRLRIAPTLIFFQVEQGFAVEFSIEVCYNGL